LYPQCLGGSLCFPIFRVDVIGIPNDRHAGKVRSNLVQKLQALSGEVSARDSAIVFSIALQHGADPETVRRALCRDSQGRASGPLGAALDVIMGWGGP
jgi:hypothetical protein